jgi:hypothetical protein
VESIPVVALQHVSGMSIDRCSMQITARMKEMGRPSLGYLRDFSPIELNICPLLLIRVLQ